jgi:hypothetical protein
MKKTVLVLAFLVCVISYQGFAKGISDGSAINNGITKLETEVKSINEKTTKIEGDVKGIDGRITKLEEKGKSDGGKIPDLRDNTKKQITSDRIPVTPKIVASLLNYNGSYDELKFYISKKFYLEIYEQKETAEIEINKDRVIINPVSIPNTPTEIEFSIDNEGILDDILGSDKGRELQILFKQQGKNYKL